MSITSHAELLGLQRISRDVAATLRQMLEHACPGMSTHELDEYGGHLLAELGAKSAPKLTYGFPGWTCISVNQEAAHGIPSPQRLLQEDDLLNIDVSAELDGYWADNGGSFVLGDDVHRHLPLVDASRQILRQALQHIKGGVRINKVEGLIEREAKKRASTSSKTWWATALAALCMRHPRKSPASTTGSIPNGFARIRSSR